MTTSREEVSNGHDGGGKLAVDFIDDVEKAIWNGTTGLRLAAISDGFLAQFQKSLAEKSLGMLPSYNTQPSTCYKCGIYLALDVGGSTLRVALIEFSEKITRGQRGEILTKRSFKIDSAVKHLRGVLVFDWMAERIEDTLASQIENAKMREGALSTGLTWSFALEQTSLHSGLILGMDKGFLAVVDLLGHDPGALIQQACLKRGLKALVRAIVNDACGTLLSEAHLDSSGRFGLVLGTGINVAVYLPVRAISLSKFGTRPSSWYDSAHNVIVNTELSTFGGRILPLTKWDELLLSAHPNPELQPGVSRRRWVVE